MDTRRDFLKKAILLSGAAGMSSVLPAAIRKAIAINPAMGSTFLDAEHIVILMQENRSFDHCFGSLKGVRGFNDPRAIKLPSGYPVWFQPEKNGFAVPPFRLNIKDTKSTWMGSLPHSRASQVEAWNYGQYDRWLAAKRPSNKDYKDLPLTMGYYNREDLPFDYALADAFTVCDHNFCSLMGSTTPNRSYFWTGKVTSQEDGWVKANLNNRDYSYGRLKWKTFPELLQENGINWKFYQNDLYCGALMSQEHRDWLLNFGCNILEFWQAYNVKFSSRYVETLQKHITILIDEVTFALGRAKVQTAAIKKEILIKKEKIKDLKIKLAQWSQDNFDKLTETEKQLFHRAFITNKADPDYRSLTSFKYEDHGAQRQVTIPKGDILHQFRKDVQEGKLATVNWLASPKYFSDHPTVPWYGTWYSSEILNILTQNPEVWKKTIFIQTFDENDGYFDHVPPFTVPDPKKPDTGMVSEGIDMEKEWIRAKDEVRAGTSQKSAREAPIGLGFRVPMIIASPWSRGGKVCSEVFDHTSTLQFLEHFINKKFKKNIHIGNISDWRRSICGDLTSAFTPFEKGKNTLPVQDKSQVIEDIFSAQFKEVPNGFNKISLTGLNSLSKKDAKTYRSSLPKQEPGTKSSCAVPYELYVDGNLSKDGKSFEIALAVDNKVFGNAAAGAPFTTYTFGEISHDKERTLRSKNEFKNRYYAVKAGDKLSDKWRLKEFQNKAYHIEVHGPNGFYRSFKGNDTDPKITVFVQYEKQKKNPLQLTGEAKLKIFSHENRELELIVENHSFNQQSHQTISFGKDAEKEHAIPVKCNQGWYDFTIRGKGKSTFLKRYAGKVETGKLGITDPLMGGE